MAVSLISQAHDAGLIPASALALHLSFYSLLFFQKFFCRIYSIEKGCLAAGSIATAYYKATQTTYTDYLASCGMIYSQNSMNLVYQVGHCN